MGKQAIGKNCTLAAGMHRSSIASWLNGIDIPRFGNHSRIVTTNAVPSAKISQTNFATVSDHMFPDGGQKCHLSVSGASA
jgi:hypothetical protein